MAITLKDIVRGKQPLPPRVVLFGIDGIGKSTLGACAPNPIFICTEKGAGNIDVPKFPMAQNYQDVIDAMDSLLTDKHDFQTLVLDTLDWLEPLIWAHVCKLGNKQSIEDFGYGKGYVEATDVWRSFLRKVDDLNSNGIAVILIAHAHIKRFDSPETEAYDRYEIKLHTKASSLVYEWADAVLFTNYKVFTKTKQDGFSEKTRAIGSGERVMYTQERPAFRAKNRYGLPESLPLGWDALVTAINQSYQPTIKEVKNA